MKALFKLSGLLALAYLLIASCIQEPAVEEPAVSSVQVTVGAGIAADPATKSEVALEEGKRVLKFTKGDRLYVWKNAYQPGSSVRYVAGMLTMVGEPSAEGKSTTFTGTLQAYDNEGHLYKEDYDFGSNPLEETIATLVHAGLNEGSDYYIITGDFNPNVSKNCGKIKFNHLVGYDVEDLMTKILSVTGNYDSENHLYTLGCSDPIFNCYISGLTPKADYQFALHYHINIDYANSYKTAFSGGHFTTDENGVAHFSFASTKSGEDNWRIQIYETNTTIDIDFGTINLTAKIYNVRRWWNGSSFCAPTNLSSVSADYTTRNGEILTGTLASNYKLQVPNGHTVVLAGVTHHAGEYVSGIECQGSATINLVDGTTNDLTPGDQNAYCGISGGMGIITIDGTGTLLASGGVGFAGISGLDGMVSIVINGGNLTVAGGANAAGIGANDGGHFGSITIKGGNLTVTGGTNAAGIGCGRPRNSKVNCGEITFSGGTVVVNPGTDGWGVGLCDTYYQSCEDIYFNGGSVTVYGNIYTSREIYINNVLQSHSRINATSNNPFVYPVPATQ